MQAVRRRNQGTMRERMAAQRAAQEGSLPQTPRQPRRRQAGTANRGRPLTGKERRKEQRGKVLVEESSKTGMLLSQNSDPLKARLDSGMRKLARPLTVPASQSIRLPVEGFGRFFAAYIARLALTTSIFSSSNPVTPLDIWLHCWYLLGCVLTFKGGRVNQQSTTKVQFTDPNQFAVHFPLAKILQYALPFVDGGVKYTFDWDMNWNVAIPSGYLDSTVPFPAAGVFPASYGRLGRLVINNAYAGLRIQTHAAVANAGFFVSNRFDDVVSALSQVGPSKTIIRNIGTHSPDCSAYAAFGNGIIHGAHPCTDNIVAQIFTVGTPAPVERPIGAVSYSSRCLSYPESRWNSFSKRRHFCTKCRVSDVCFRSCLFSCCPSEH
jgi:hypothetical protein